MWTDFIGKIENAGDKEKRRTELPYDKMLQYFHVYVNMAVSLLLVGQNYFSSTISCHTDHKKGETYKTFVDDSCGAFMTNYSYYPHKETFLPHKVFPFVYMSQVAVFLIPYLLWQFLAVPSLLTFLNSALTYSNDMATQLKEWYGGFKIKKNPSRDLELKHIKLLSLDINELARYWLQRRAPSLLNIYTLQHATYCFFSLAYMVVYATSVPYGALSACQFWCQMIEGTVHRCIITNALLLRVVYLINMILLILTFFICFVYIIHFRKEISVNDSFFFRNIPGLATRSFMESVKGPEQTFGGLKLLSSFLDHNESFIENFSYLKKTARLTNGNSLSKLRSRWENIKLQSDKTPDEIPSSYKIQSKSNKEPRPKQESDASRSDCEIGSDHSKDEWESWKRGSEYATPAFSSDEETKLDSAGENPTSLRESVIAEQKRKKRK